MKKFLQPGDILDVVAPYTTVAGQGVLVGTLLFGVAVNDIANGATGQVVTRGVVTIGKTASLAVAIGDALYWNNSTRLVNKTSSGQKEVGIAVSACGSGAGEVLIDILLIQTTRASVAA